MLLLQLTKEAEAWLQKNGYTKSTIYHNFIRHWNKLRKTLGNDSEFSKRNTASYCMQLFGKNLMDEIPSSLSLKEYRISHALRSLAEFYESGSISGTSMSGSAIRQPLSEGSLAAIRTYMYHLDTLEYKEASKNYAYATLHAFLVSCPVETMRKDNILDFLNGLGVHTKITVNSMLKVIKRFLSFLYAQGIVPEDFSVCILSQKRRGGTELPSVYTPAEVAGLLRYIRTNGFNRSRNYAMILLIAVFGFRAKDIAGLTLENIDWDKGLIRVAQSKTSLAISHTLTDLTANALADYILNGRPASSDRHVFLKDDGSSLSPTSVSTMVATGFVNSGVIIGNRKHGSHSLRHSLASNMISQGEQLLVVSKVLGHSSVDTSRIYAKVDVNHLRLVELEVPTNE